MFQVRPAYSPVLVASIPAARPMVRVGEAAAAPAAPPSPPLTLQDAGLYLALPAAVAGAGIFLAGLGVAWTLGAGVLGAGAGYLYLDHANKEKANQATQNAADAVAAAEKARIAKLTVVEVSMQTDAIGVQAKSGLGLFTAGIVPGGSTIDWKLAAFPSQPTDAVVKQLTDLQKALSTAGYQLAASQVADVASTAASLRDVLGG